MKGVFARIFRQNILIGWESLFNRIAQNPVVADFQYSSWKILVKLISQVGGGIKG
jgi:hypothetical protein